MKTPNLIKLLTNEGNLYRRNRGQVINVTSSHNEFNLIKSGYVKRYLIRNDGSLSVQSVYGPNYFFPINQVFNSLFNYKIENSDLYYYECITPVEIYSIGLEDFCKIVTVSKNPYLYRELMAILGRRLEFHIHHATNDSLSSAYTRVADQLIFLAKLFSEQIDDGSYKMQLPLRHQDIGDMLNLTRETVSKQLSIMHKKGLIHNSKYIVIQDMQALINEADEK